MWQHLMMALNSPKRAVIYVDNKARWSTVANEGCLYLLIRSGYLVLLSHTHLEAGTLCFFCRSTRSLSPTWRYTSTNVLKAVSRTVAMGSPNSFTMQGTSRDTDRDCAPCLKQITQTLRVESGNHWHLRCKQQTVWSLFWQKINWYWNEGRETATFHVLTNYMELSTTREATR
jgi:hypothetical protein